MIRKKWMIKTGVVAMILCLLLAACASKEEDSEFDDDNEVSVEDQSDDGDKDIAEDNFTEDEDSITDDVLAIVSEGSEHISQEFLDFLESYFQDRDVSALQELVVDQELTDEELKAYGDDSVVAEHIQDVENNGGLFLRVDGDNDGIEDLFVWVLDGGSSGNTSRHFLKGLEDGSFQCTAVCQGMSRELAFVEYADTVYLLETEYDYNRKAANGFRIGLYQNGEAVETLLMMEEISSYEPEIIYHAEGYEEVAEKYAEEGRNGFFKVGSDSLIYETGSAETREDTDEARRILGLTGTVSMYYRSDLDNDGEPEWYGKAVFYPSSMGTVMGLDEMMYEEGGGDASGVRMLETYSLGYEGIPLYFWVDTVGNQQVVFLLSYQGLDKEYLYGYLIEDGQTQKMIEIEYTGISEISQREVTVSFYTDWSI